jgi:hypothetical protein
MAEQKRTRVVDEIAFHHVGRGIDSYMPRIEEE